MPARAKLTATATERLLDAVGRGESLTAASRMVDVTPQAVRKYAKRHPVFAARLAEARRPDLLAEVDDPLAPDSDWMRAALMLERQYPDHWALPTDPS